MKKSGSSTQGRTSTSVNVNGHPPSFLRAPRSSHPPSLFSVSSAGKVVRYAALFILIAGLVYFKARRFLPPSSVQLPVSPVWQEPQILTSPRVEDLPRSDIFSDAFIASISDEEVIQRRDAIRSAFKVCLDVMCRKCMLTSL